MTNILCNPFWCPQSSKGDGICDPNCMFSFCNFDSNLTTNPRLNPENSDCYQQCIDNYSCLPSNLGNGICDQNCNNAFCGHDLGDCGYCSPNCKIYTGFPGNLSKNCIDSCDNENCYYGLGYCKDCSPGCSSEMLGDEICDKPCNVVSCNYDFGDCNNNQCSQGCKRWMIGDNNCNEECNNLACNWDGGDCDCSQGCHSYMKSNKVCEADCDNLACDYDGGDCQKCASGCLKSMLGDGICNSACDVNDCNYDNYDCGCADGCGIESYGQCKDSCMNSLCRYDTNSISKCQNINQILFALHYGFILKNLAVNISPDNCTSTTSCLPEEVLDSNSCHTNCKNFNCINSWSMCSTNTCADSNCLMCNSKNLGDCFKCKSNTYQFYGYCLDKCPGGHEAFILFGNYPVCLLPNDYSTKDNPAVYYVTSLANTDIYEGNGSFNSPFASLSLALASVYTKYTIIYLLNDGDHYFTCVNASNPVSTLLADVCDPLNRAFSIKYLVIASHINSPIVIKTKPDNNFPVFTITNSTIVTIKNVIFIGKDILSGCPSIENSYCSYCATAILKSDGYYYSDQGIRLTSYLNASTCSTYHSKTLFNVYLNSKLILQNVNFTDWRIELKSIITSIGGIIVFINVNFDNIRCYWTSTTNYESQKNSVIYFLDCGDPNYNCGSFEYINGWVSRLNNGYEYGSAEFSGFLSADKIRNVMLKNVTFVNNIVYSPYVNSNTYSLIKLSLFRSIEISYCVFDKNIANYGLIYLSPSSLTFRDDVNSNNEIIDLLLYHVYIHDTIFKSNFGYNGGLLSAIYDSQLQRILLENLFINNNAVAKVEMIYIGNINDSPEYLVDTEIVVKDANGNLVKATLKKRDFIFKNSIITHNNSGRYLSVFLQMLFNTRIKNLTVESNGLETQNINKILWSYYVIDNDLYTKKLVDVPGNIDCYNLLWASYLNNHELSESKFINNNCKRSTTNLWYYSPTNANITDVTFEGNIGNVGTGNCMYCWSSRNLRITNSRFNNNTSHYEGGAGCLALGTLDTVYIENTIISNNHASMESAIWFVGNALFLNNVTVESNLASSGNGIVSFQPNADQAALFNITNSVFKENISLNNEGGAIAIYRDLWSDYQMILYAKNNLFIYNQAPIGSAIYIDTNIVLSNDSIIESCTFMHNTAEYKGTIANLNRKGILTISNSLFVSNYAEFGSALYFTNPEDSSMEKSKMILKFCNFTSNSGRSVISTDDIAIYSYIETFKCIFQNNDGSALSLVYDYWKDTESIIANSTTTSGTVYLTNATAECELTIFTNNTSTENAEAIKAKSSSYFHCEKCSFYKNSANNGGVLYFDQFSYFSIENSHFSHNFCVEKGAAIYVTKSGVYSVLKNSKLFSNYAGSEGLIYSLLSNIIIDNCQIYDNSANKITPGFYLALSNAIINNSEFHDQKGNYGGFLYLDSHTILTVKNSSFTNGESYISGGSIYAFSSSLILESTAFENSISSSGNAIFIFSTTLNISNCQFLNAYSSDSGGVISVSGGKVFIEKSIFENFNNSAIDGSEMEFLIVTETMFKNSLSKNRGAISCINTDYVYISSCNFTNHTSLYGGALYLTFTSNPINTQPYRVISTEFLNNTSSAGGAIFIDNININIASCGFYNNKVLDIFEEHQDTPESGIGGAIKLGCSYSEVCNFNVISNNFERNSADLEGGAVIWREVIPNFENNWFENNKAEYGENIASYAVSMKVLNSNWAGALDDLASGQLTTTPLIIGLIDHLGSIVTTDNWSVGEFISLSQDVALSEELKVKAIKGIYIFSSFIISAKPGSKFLIEVQTNGIDVTKSTKANDGLTYNSSIFVNITLRDCELGEATVGVNCVICTKGLYSLDPKNEKCLACPDEAICYGNYTMVPKPGYWRSDMLSRKFWPCPNSNACIGSDSQNISYTGNCGEGYTGNLCQSCSEGYYKLMKNKCDKCQSLSIVIIKMSGITLGFLILWWLMVRISKNSAYKPKALISIYIKILINYMQLVALTATFNLSWPHYLNGLFSIQNSASFISDQVFSFDCLLYYSKDLGGSNAIFYQKLFVMAILPLLIPLIAIAFWFLIWLRKKNWILLIDNIITSSIIAAFLVHPSLIKYYFSSFDCTELDHGKEWLVDDLNIRCWDSEHIFYTTAFSLPAILVWGIGIPAICLFLIMKNKENLSNINVRIKYGFLFNGYKPTSYYWEFVIIYRKIAIICCTVFLATVSVNIQALTALFILILCLYLQFKIMPYNEDHLNRLEAISISASAITIYCGLYFLTGALDQVTEFIFFIAIILANLCFLIYWIIKAGNAYITEIIKKISFLRKKYTRSSTILTRSSLKKSKTGRIGEIAPETDVNYYQGENLNPKGINFKEINMKFLFMENLIRKMKFNREEIEECSFEENDIEKKSVDEDNRREADMEVNNFEEKYLNESKAEDINYIKVAEIEINMVNEEKSEMDEDVIINSI